MASYCNPKCLVSSIVVELAIIHKEHQLDNQNAQSCLIYILQLHV